MCDWIEEYLVHGPGDVQGTPIVLDVEFRAFIWRAYELYPKGHPLAGRRVYRRGVLSRPKGRAKSELAGMIASAEGLAEVRFDGWDARGNPVGRPIISPIVRCFATEEQQAGNTYDNVQYMLAEGKVFDEYPGIDVGLTRTFLPNGGEIVALSSAASSKDGGKDTFDVFDETHLWVLPRLKALHATVTRNLIKRRAADGWSLETSTMYAPGEDSVAEETHKTAANLESVLFDHKQAPDDVDIDDDESLRSALEFVYGPAASWMDIDGIIGEFRNPQNRESDNRRYWLNQPWTTEEKFVTPAQWDGCRDTDRTIPEGSPVVLSLDGSFNNDSTAVAVILVDERPHVDLVGCWERPEDADPLWEVDILDVEASIRAARLRWRVLELCADKYRWARTLQVLDDEGLVVAEFPQTASRMTPATKRLYDLLTTGGLTHSGDERLRRHVLNATVKNDARGYRLSKESKASGNKIDAAVAAVMGLDRAMFHAANQQHAHVYFPSDDRPETEPDPAELHKTVSPEGFRILTQEETTVVRCRICFAAVADRQDLCPDHR